MPGFINIFMRFRLGGTFYCDCAARATDIPEITMYILPTGKYSAPQTINALYGNIPLRLFPLLWFIEMYALFKFHASIDKLSNRLSERPGSFFQQKCQESVRGPISNPSKMTSHLNIPLQNSRFPFAKSVTRFLRTLMRNQIFQGHWRVEGHVCFHQYIFFSMN